MTWLQAQPIWLRPVFTGFHNAPLSAPMGQTYQIRGEVGVWDQNSPAPTWSPK